MRAAALLGVAAALATGCVSPTIPGRDAADVYAFELPTEPPQVMRWPAGQTIRVHVVDGSTADRTALLRNAFERGAAAWEEVAAFAEYRLAAAPDAASADVVLAFSDVGLPVITDGCRPAVTRAVTTFCLAAASGATRGLRVFPLQAGGEGRVKMVVLVLASEASDPATVRRLVAHELGHVLGIGRHSGDARDLMWRTDPQVARPSRRDAATVHVLYHVRPDIVP